MSTILFIAIAAIIGAAFGWLFAKSKSNANALSEKQGSLNAFNALDKEFTSYKAKAEANADSVKNTLLEKDNLIQEKNDEVKDLKKDKEKLQLDLATAIANNKALDEKLALQKEEIKDIGIKFNLEFENIANKILDTKSEKFTELNKANLKTILDPLGQNIKDFKKQVDDVYKAESQERFSLGKEVKRLAELNQVISEEAKNLTKALKGESKTQGNWGEMILESILEKSGLVKDREYFMEQELLDADG